MRSKHSTVAAWFIGGLLAIAAQTANVPVCLGASIESEINAIWKETLKLYEAGRYEEAERVAKRGLTRAAAILGTSHKVTSRGYHELCKIYWRQGRLDEAEDLARRAVAIREKAYGHDAPHVARTLHFLALILDSRGEPKEAETHLKRVLMIHEKATGTDSRETARAQKDLAWVYLRQGRSVEANALFRKAVDIAEKLPKADPLRAQSIYGLAYALKSRNKFAEAELLYKKAQGMLEEAGRANHPTYQITLRGLADLLLSSGRYNEAEAVLRTALAGSEKTFGAFNIDVARAHAILGNLYNRQGRRDAAELALGRALEIRQKLLGVDHPEVADTMTFLGFVYINSGKFAQAETLLKSALEIRRRPDKTNPLRLTSTLQALGRLHAARQEHAQAESLFREVVAIRDTELGAGHRSTASALSDLAAVLLAAKKFDEAAMVAGRAGTILVKQGEEVGDLVAERVKEQVHENLVSRTFHTFLAAAWRARTEQGSSATAYADEAFIAAQLAHNSTAAAAISKMAIRFGEAEGIVGQLVRQGQDLLLQRQAVDRELTDTLIASPGKGDLRNRAKSRALLMQLDGEIEKVSLQIRQKFPQYAELAMPQPLSVKAAMANLGMDEVLLQFALLPNETFVWAVTKTEARWVRIPLGNKALSNVVAVLRCGLDEALWHEAIAERCRKLLPEEPAVETVGLSVRRLPFDLTRAHDLFRALFGQLEDLIKDKHLLLVPAGPLASLPFHVLVTKLPHTTIPARLTDYRDVPWLGTRQPISVLPSAASLKALREHARASRANRRYLGVGNPLLDGTQDDPQEGAYFKKRAEAARAKQDCAKQPQSLQIASTRGPRSAASSASMFRGSHADIEQVRRWSPLPETADELCEIGRRLGVPESDILLGARASETTLKQLSNNGRLADYAVLHFATHGALSGDVQGLAEPGLILTPPTRGTIDAPALDHDDGFLTASEIATLNLDADWIVLSACNTAGASVDAPEALAGLARAFFYAGARALLVSHWEVESSAAIRLTTRAFDVLEARGGQGRAEALRLSMADLIAKGEPWQAHPAQWAPFVVVGEGAR